MATRQRRGFWVCLVGIAVNSWTLAANDIGTWRWVVGFIGFCFGLAGLLLAARTTP